MVLKTIEVSQWSSHVRIGSRMCQPRQKLPAEWIMVLSLSSCFFWHGTADGWLRRVFKPLLAASLLFSSSKQFSRECSKRDLANIHVLLALRWRNKIAFPIDMSGFSSFSGAFSVCGNAHISSMFCAFVPPFRDVQKMV